MDKSLREEFDEAKAEFDKLKGQLDEVQEKYTEMSDKRIEAMSAMFQAIDVIGKSEWRKQQKADKLADYDLTNAIRLSPHRKQIRQFLQEADDLLGGTEVKRLSESWLC